MQALEIINKREQGEDGLLAGLARLRQQVQQRPSCRVMTEGAWTKVQLPAPCAQLYELRESLGKVGEGGMVLKMVVKNFTGSSVSMSLSSRCELVDVRECEYRVKGEKIIRIKNPPLVGGRIYLTLVGQVDLTVFKMKYEFEREQLSESRVRKSSSLKLMKIGLLRQGQQVVDRSREKVSPRSVIRERLGLQSGRKESLQREKQKSTRAHLKRMELQLYKEKSKSFKSIGNKCTVIFNEYRSQMEEEGQRRGRVVREVARLVLVVQFMVKVQGMADRKLQGMDRVMRRMRAVRKCADRFMRIRHELKEVQPLRIKRELVPVYHHLCVAARTFLKVDSLVAMKMVVVCFEQTRLGVGLNSAFNLAAGYRRKVRFVQRFWLHRNDAQIMLFKLYLETQVQELLKKHPYFSAVKEEFYGRNMVHNLCWQYLKDSAGRTKQLFEAHRNKLEEIEDVKNLNLELQKFNAKALKKHQKPLMEIPNEPCRPQCHYFRDLGILKTMARSWFEIEYRRHTRRLKGQSFSSKK